jgi:hypothetical protein
MLPQGGWKNSASPLGSPSTAEHTDVIVEICVCAHTRHNMSTHTHIVTRHTS